MKEPPEYLETKHPVRARTAERLESVFSQMNSRAGRTTAGAVSLGIGRAEYRRNAQGQWTRNRRRKNPAWLALPRYLVYGDASGPKVRLLFLKGPRDLTWRKTDLPAIRRAIRAADLSDGGLNGGIWSTLQWADAKTWERTKWPRVEWNGREYAPVK